jgi:catechol 2,3-dioxygenase-like lactoylglutathione lyase family enzyme
MHHYAFVTTDLEKTRSFYEDLIGLTLVATWAEVDHLPARDRVYCHTFFELADGSALAFFQFEDPDQEIPVAAPASPFAHIALNCDLQNQQEIYDRLRAAGYTAEDVVIKDHGYCTSLYVYDPNGVRLEFTADCDDMPEILVRQKATAHETLRRWLAGDHASNNELRSRSGEDVTTSPEG